MVYYLTGFLFIGASLSVKMDKGEKEIEEKTTNLPEARISLNSMSEWLYTQGKSNHIVMEFYGGNLVKWSDNASRAWVLMIGYVPTIHAEKARNSTQISVGGCDYLNSFIAFGSDDDLMMFRLSNFNDFLSDAAYQ
jgi:hypothetical protein